MRENIQFQSEETTLRGWLYKPDDSRDEKSPVIVMAHGFSAVKEQYLDRYAEVFAAAGFGVLVYDHANFGESDGLPRQEVDPTLQKRGYRDAITYVQSLPWGDPQRIGIWGTSFSGGHVIEVAAIDRRVCCAVAQVPQISGYESARRRTRADLLPTLLNRFHADRAARFGGQSPAMLPAVSDDPVQPCAMAGGDSYFFFSDTRSFAPNWRNEVTLRSAELSRENEPGIHIARISPTPFLMIVAENDVLTATDICLTAFERALQPKKLLLIQGGHFDPYVAQFETTSQAACQWFETHLTARR
ncbi:alpha/beta hydrolase [Phyllobacterium meliloti]|uniref:alpha/beta hydrolase n=1 Tax=Phyllobacterium meliloti TaxID=555317 RepID=UPI001D13AC54|nr:alpha/beta hydrolase [Phyllobacterium sp. T1293]UGX87259.1 alpha/beta hydrolase [Phyllobacterium sp. T1293]